MFLQWVTGQRAALKGRVAFTITLGRRCQTPACLWAPPGRRLACRRGYHLLPMIHTYPGAWLLPSPVCQHECAELHMPSVPIWLAAIGVNDAA